MAEYSALCEYVDSFKAEIDAGREVLLEVRDLSTWERKVVKAVLIRRSDALEGADLLRIEDYTGDFRPDVWSIRIVEELDADALESIPRSDLRRYG